MGSRKKKIWIESDASKVARGAGRMVDGSYQDYTTADKQHINDANTNRNAQFQDIAQNSGLGSNWGAGFQSLLGNVKKKKQAGANATLLGGAASGKQTLGG